MGKRVLTCLFLLLQATVAAERRDEDLPGAWRGECRSFDPIKKPKLSIELTIHPDATVSGKVGDAALVDGRWRPRKNSEPRVFNQFDFRIDFRLSGPLSAEDGVVRDGGRINVDLTGGELRGWLVTTGPHVGPRNSMQLKMTDLILKRVNSANHQLGKEQ